MTKEMTLIERIKTVSLFVGMGLIIYLLVRNVKATEEMAEQIRNAMD